MQTAFLHVLPAKGSEIHSGAETPMQHLLTRRSIRRYRPEPVAAEQLAAILEVMTWAPSAHNRQPLRIVVVRTSESKAALANAMGQRLRTDRRQDGDAADVIEADAQRSFARITSSPVVLVLCADMSPMDQYPDPARQNSERLMAAQSVAAAAQNGLLAAHALGLGACWMCAPLFCPEAVTSALRLPANWEPQILLTMGHPAGDGKPSSRRAVSEITWSC